MFKKKKQIKVFVELFGGLYLKVQKKDFPLETGLELVVTEYSTPKNILKTLDLPYSKSIIIYVNGERAAANTKLKNGDKILCLTPASGG